MCSIIKAICHVSWQKSAGNKKADLNIDKRKWALNLKSHINIYNGSLFPLPHSLLPKYITNQKQTWDWVMLKRLTYSYWNRNNPHNLLQETGKQECRHLCIHSILSHNEKLNTSIQYQVHQHHITCHQLPPLPPPRTHPHQQWHPGIADTQKPDRSCYSQPQWIPSHPYLPLYTNARKPFSWT